MRKGIDLYIQKNKADKTDPNKGSFEDVLLKSYVRYVDLKNTSGFKQACQLDSLIHAGIIPPEPPYPDPNDISIENHRHTHDYCNNELVKALVRSRLGIDTTKPIPQATLETLAPETLTPKRRNVLEEKIREKKKTRPDIADRIKEQKQKKISEPGISELYTQGKYCEALNRIIETKDENLLEDVLSSIEGLAKEECQSLLPPAQEMVGKRAYEKGQYDKATSLLQDPSPELVDSYYQLGNFDKAKEYFEKLSTNTSVSLEAGACSYLATGELKTAARLLEILALQKDSPELHSILADTYIKLDEYSEAKKHMEYCPDNDETRMLKAKIAIYENPDTDIEETLESMTDPDIKSRFISECSDLYPPEQAIPLLEKATEYQPKKETYLKLAEAYENILDLRSSFNNYEKALKLERDTDTLKKQMTIGRRIGEWTTVQRNQDFIENGY
ncbi:MAG: hypothetical protein R6V53_02240 [Candidatus Woesearchaeota archaeon]